MNEQALRESAAGLFVSAVFPWEFTGIVRKKLQELHK
jgi:hypothetical protein